MTDTPIMTASVPIVPEIHTPEPFDSPPPLIEQEFAQEFYDYMDYQHMHVIHSILEPTDSHDISMNIQNTQNTQEIPHTDSQSTESTEHMNNAQLADICESDPPLPDQTSVQALVHMLCTMDIKEMEEYGAEHKIDIGLAYNVAENTTSFTHIMLTTDYVWLNIQNTNESENLPRFVMNEIVYENCAKYFVDCCLDGDMRYTTYPDGTTSYWLRLELQTTRLMRNVLFESKRNRSSLMTRLIESIVDDVVDAIYDEPPLKQYITKVFMPERCS